MAEELYSGPPETFISTRTEREKAAKGAGEKALAAAIRQLAKPNAAAWLANTLVRQRPEDIGPFLDLGEGLRAASATLDRDQLRELDKQQHRLIYALVGQARRLAVGTGHRVSDDTARGLEDTLRAALADGSAADELRTGRLTDVLHRTGFPVPGVPGRVTTGPQPAPAAPPAARTPAARTPAAPVDVLQQRRAAKLARAAEQERERAEAARAARAAEIEQAEQDEHEARAAAQRATGSRDRARLDADRAAAAAREAAGLAARLRADLEQAEQDLAEREQAELRTQAALERADGAAAEAARLLQDATERRDRLAQI